MNITVSKYSMGIGCNRCHLNKLEYNEKGNYVNKSIQIVKHIDWNISCLEEYWNFFFHIENNLQNKTIYWNTVMLHLITVFPLIILMIPDLFQRYHTMIILKMKPRLRGGLGAELKPCDKVSPWQVSYIILFCMNLIIWRLYFTQYGARAMENNLTWKLKV